MAQLTSDIIAHAVVAAARSYDLDPCVVLTSQFHPHRRVIVAAISALEREGGFRLKRLARVLGTRDTTIHHARKRSHATFRRAEDAAIRAVRSARRSQTAQPAAPPRETAAVVKVIDVAETPARERPAARPQVSADDALASKAGDRARLAVATGKPVAWSDGETSLSGRIRAELARGEPLSGIALMHRLDAKELAVFECLRSMAGQGLVRPLDAPAQGVRYRKWELSA